MTAVTLMCAAIFFRRFKFRFLCVAYFFDHKMIPNNTAHACILNQSAAHLVKWKFMLNMCHRISGAIAIVCIHFPLMISNVSPLVTFCCQHIDASFPKKWLIFQIEQICSNKSLINIRMVRASGFSFNPNCLRRSSWLFGP